jgi:hypothetical protein
VGRVDASIKYPAANSLVSSKVTHIDKMKMNGQSSSHEISWELQGTLLRHDKAKWSVKDLNN